MSGARLRAEQVLTRLLCLIVFGNFVTQPLLIAAEWAGSRYSVEGLAAPVIGLSYGARLLREAGRSPRPGAGATWRLGRFPDLAFIVLMAAAGLALEVVVFTPSVDASMNNAGFGALSACAYAGAARLSWRVSVPILLVAMVGHAVALKATPTEGMQGALELASIWAATRVVVAELRRAGRAAEDACELARQAEREEANARVHDALGLLRVAARGDGAGGDLQRAAEETTRRTDAWLNDSAVAAGLAELIGSVAGQFPDLDIELKLDANLVMSDPGAVTAVGRAVHTLLGNVREHAGAACVEIIATATSDGWELTIRDDGRGFDVASTSPRSGLTRYTRDALGAVGVAMSLQSAPGLGTTVTLRAAGEPGLREARVAGRDREAGRFAAWRSRPQGGIRRAAWISDVSQAVLVASYTVMVIAGYGHLLRHSGRPAVAGVLVVAGTIVLILTWLGGPRPRAILVVTATVFAVCAGGVITALNGQDAASGDKLGIMLMVYSCMLLAAARPDYRWTAVGLSVGPLIVLGRVDVASGVVTALLLVMGSLVAARLVSAVTEFGTQADADRHRAAALERRSVAPLLFRQASVISAAATSSGSNGFADRLSVVSQQAERYLRPACVCPLSVGLHAGLHAVFDIDSRLDLDTTHLDCDLSPSAVRRVTDAVTEIASELLRGQPAGRVSVRGVGESRRWQLTLLAAFGHDQPAPELPDCLWKRLRADLAAVAIELTTQTMPGADRYVTLRPVVPEPRQETAIDTPNRRLHPREAKDVQRTQ